METIGKCPSRLLGQTGNLKNTTKNINPKTVRPHPQPLLKPKPYALNASALPLADAPMGSPKSRSRDRGNLAASVGSRQGSFQDPFEA